jgi:anti-sigma factor RsiW
MSDCRTIDPLITPYVDDDIDVDARRHVDEHVRRCPPCHSRVSAERAVRQLVRVKRAEISRDTASPALRERCLALHVASAADAASRWRVRMTPFAIAGLVLVAGGAFVYEATGRSTRLLAAQLTADHVKCFGMNALLGTNPDAAVIEQAMASTFGWEMRVPESQEAGLELVGARPCVYAKGRAAHLMYRHHGQPLSVFMLPQFTRPGASASHPETLGMMGHEAIVWSQGGRTFVLIAREPQQEMARVAAIVQASMREER